MRGLVERLILWLERAAAGTLDGDVMAVHPPVAYSTFSSSRVVVRADLGPFEQWTSSGELATFAIALCTQRGDRLDVVHWLPLADYAAAVKAGIATEGQEGDCLVAASAVLLRGDIGFEYPSDGELLISGLEKQGAPRKRILELLALTANGNISTAARRGIDLPAEGEDWNLGPGEVPQLLLIGTPSREPAPGQRRMHLVAWRIDSLGGRISDLLGSLLKKHSDGFQEIREDVEDIALRWVKLANVSWSQVFEARPEVTRRRDAAAAIGWVEGKRVVVLGCGAIGAPIAEAIVRAGAAHVLVDDNGIVTPGILVRQPYNDSDVGQAKALALAERLRRVRPDANVDPLTADAVAYVTTPGTLAAGRVDLLIDATADAGVRSAIERVRATSDHRPALLTVMVGHESRRGVVAVSHENSHPGGYDALRRLGIAARTTDAEALSDISDDLYPRAARADLFFPEPGCSSPTFQGSQVESVALSAALLSAGLDALAGRLPFPAARPTASACIRLEATDDNSNRDGSTTWVGWAADLEVASVDKGFQIRFSPQALATMRAEARRGQRIRGPRIETGGMLLGEIDEATGVAWVDIATSPTPDSRCSAEHFQHGTVGAQDLVDHYRQSAGGLTTFIGMWHTHPYGPARPSETDEIGMANLVAPILGGPPRCLMVIVGGDRELWGRWLADGESRQPDIYAEVIRRDPTGTPPPQPQVPPGPSFLAGKDLLPENVRRRPWWYRILPSR